jgi:hypothetical protein
VVDVVQDFLDGVHIVLLIQGPQVIGEFDEFGALGFQRVEDHSHVGDAVVVGGDFKSIIKLFRNGQIREVNLLERVRGRCFLRLRLFLFRAFDKLVTVDQRIDEVGCPASRARDRVEVLCEPLVVAFSRVVGQQFRIAKDGVERVSQGVSNVGELLVEVLVKQFTHVAFPRSRESSMGFVS